MFINITARAKISNTNIINNSTDFSFSMENKGYREITVHSIPTFHVMPLDFLGIKGGAQKSARISQVEIKVQC